MSRRLIGCAVAMLAAVAAGAIAVLAMAQPTPGHRPFHIGCLDHNHGPAWHAGHGRVLGAPQSGIRRGRPAADDPGEDAGPAPISPRSTVPRIWPPAN